MYSLLWVFHGKLGDVGILLFVFSTVKVVVDRVWSIIQVEFLLRVKFSISVFLTIKASSMLLMYIVKKIDW